MLQIQGDDPLAVSGAQQCHHLPLAEGHRQGTAKGHQGHGTEQTDVGKARPVFPHPVEHSRQGDEVLRLVVEAFIAPQGLQDIDATKNEHPIGRFEPSGQKSEPPWSLLEDCSDNH